MNDQATAHRLYTAIVRPGKVDSVKDALQQLGVNGFTFTEIRGNGKQRGPSTIYRGKKYSLSFFPKYQIDVAVPADIGDRVNDAIANAARTGEIGDGRIWQKDIFGYGPISSGESSLILPDPDGFYTIAAVVRPNKLEDVVEAIEKLGLKSEMFYAESRGHGKQKGHMVVYRGKEYSVSFLPKISIDLLVPAEKAHDAYQAILAAARTGEIGDGRIWLTKLDGVTSIETGNILCTSDNQMSKYVLFTSVIPPNKVDDVKDELEKIGHTGMTQTEVYVYDTPFFPSNQRFGRYPKMQIEMAVPREISDAVNQAMIKGARTGVKSFATGEVYDRAIYQRPLNDLTLIREQKAA